MTYLSPEEAARRSSFSRKVIYRAIEDGELEAFKPRGRLRIPEESFEAWMRARPVEAVARSQPSLVNLPSRRSHTGSFRAALRAIDGGHG